MESNSILQWATLITNISIIIVGIKLVRHLAMIELKVETLWDYFQNHLTVK